MNELKIFYEDNHIIVVEKQANILSQKDATNDIDMLSIVKKYIKDKYHKPGNVYLGLVHRLDRPVGGLMVFAKTSKAASRLSEQIRTHTFKKTYLAVVRGKMKNLEGHFEDYLKKTENGNTVISTKENGKLAQLSYKVLDYNKENNQTLVEINLKTGRHHQIRVQFASRGYPLCGDQRYGETDYTQIALYAYKIEFLHPISKQKLIFKNTSIDNIYLSKFTL